MKGAAGNNIKYFPKARDSVSSVPAPRPREQRVESHENRRTGSAWDPLLHRVSVPSWTFD